ncbi:MAG: hypothetical protein RKE49_02850 [Oceanicaulis sp.]
MAMKPVYKIALAFASAWAVCAAPAAIAQQSIPQDDPQPARIDPDQLQAVDPSRFQLEDFTRLRPVIQDTRERDPRLAIINWAEAAEDRRRDLAEYREQLSTRDDAAGLSRAPAQGPLPQLAERSRANIRPVHMPVLLPGAGPQALTTRPGGEPGLMLMTRAYFYDASWHEDGVSVHVGGSRLINHRGNDVARAAGLNRGRGGDGYRIVTNESGLTADFSRYGAAYTVTVECASASDPRCADEAYLRALLDRLIVAGGNPEGEG